MMSNHALRCSLLMPAGIPMLAYRDRKTSPTVIRGEARVGLAVHMGVYAILADSILSMGSLTLARNAASTCVYRIVVRIELCPSST